MPSLTDHIEWCWLRGISLSETFRSCEYRFPGQTTSEAIRQQFIRHCDEFLKGTKNVA